MNQVLVLRMIYSNLRTCVTTYIKNLLLTFFLLSLFWISSISKYLRLRVIEDLKSLFNDKQMKFDIFDYSMIVCIQHCISIISLWMRWSTLQKLLTSRLASFFLVEKKITLKTSMFNISRIFFSFALNIMYRLIFFSSIWRRQFWWTSILQKCIVSSLSIESLKVLKILEFDSMIVYEHLYESVCAHSLNLSFEKLSSIQRQNQCIKDCLIDMFAEMQEHKKSVKCIHKEVVDSLEISWSKIFNNRTCMWCLRRKSENILTCDHVICDACVWVFENRLSNAKYEYKLENCLLCLSGTLKIRLKSSIAEIRILSIDGGESRDVMSLEFLSILQDKVELDCSIQDLFDLTFEISFGISLCTLWITTPRNGLDRFGFWPWTIDSEPNRFGLGSVSFDLNRFGYFFELLKARYIRLVMLSNLYSKTLALLLSVISNMISKILW
jgi:hypothetical protein